MDKVHSDKLILELSTAVIEQAEADIKTFKPQRFQDVFPALVRSNLQLQGIAGTQKTLVAILNGKTVEVGKTILVEIATIPVQIRCLHIDKRSVAVGFLGEKQTLELP
jgi:hypothetical protein